MNHRKVTKKWFALSIIFVVLSLPANYYIANRVTLMVTPATPINNKVSKTSSDKDATSSSNVLTLNEANNYGDKYADGILPVGDNQYSTTTAEKGKIFLCHANFVPFTQAGAQTRGSWFVGTTKWDRNKKSSIQGSVAWQQRLSVVVEGEKRIITTNDLPDHSTGVFPVANSDPARVYDANPNTIKEQSLTYTLSANPIYNETPSCMSGEVGVMLTGSAIFNGFDAGGRDAGAWEVQDACQGHPQGTGIYHYHSLSSCIKNIGVYDVIGFALDGFPITGPKINDKNYLTTSDLDECHGITSKYTLDSKSVTGYHYVMTEDFPYSVSCFRATATDAPGQHTGANQPSGTSNMPPMQGQQDDPRLRGPTERTELQ